MSETSPGGDHHASSVAHSASAGGLAALATISASTALTSVLHGASWLIVIIVVAMIIACTGVGLRALAAPAIVVAAGQLGVLLLGVTAIFTSHAIAVFLPGPGALAELSNLLTQAAEQVRTGVPPVESGPGMLLLIALAIGLASILVDTLVATVAVPAAAGLVLLCIYAVPASLSDEMLPWWSFVLGACAFAALISVHGHHRRWRRFLPVSPSRSRSRAAASVPVALVSIAVAVSILAGASVTAIGTVGQLPGASSDDSATTSTGMGINPFTSLRGMLNLDEETELFRVRGLDDERHLLRAFTLDTYRNNEGWTLAERDALPADAPAVEALGTAGNTSDAAADQAREIAIEPIHWQDVWLPVYGTPLAIDGIDGQWYFDDTSGTVFNERSQRPPNYTVTSSLAEPDRDTLRESSADIGEPAPVYTELDPIDPEVVTLTKEITAGQQTAFDKAEALWRFFVDDGRFTYDTRTAAASDDDALADFVLHGRRGFCEQFASAMAAMLRVENIPARVAVGFTAGSDEGSYRSITSRDAHAWVEAYFGEDLGWVSFDPTPLDDGRGTVPSYLDEQDDSAGGDNDSAAQPPGAADAPAPQAPDSLPAEQDGSASDELRPSGIAALASAPYWVRWPAWTALVLASLLTGAVVALTRRARARRAASETGTSVGTLSLANQWLPVATAGCWLIGLSLLGWTVSWWLGLGVLTIGGTLVTPWLLRDHRRRRRLNAITMNGSTAARAVWDELIDECADRQMVIEQVDTLRDAARRVVQRQRLDSPAQEHLHTLVAMLERSWYGPEASLDPELPATFEALRQGIRRAAPLTLRSRFLPPSVLTRSALPS